MSLKVSGLHFGYGKEDILRDLTFEIPSGSLTAVLGENGSGKSTLLKNINRILNPRIGTVLVGEVAVEEMSRRDIAGYMGYLPQRQQAAYCTVFETVLLGRKARGGDGEPIKKDLEKVEEILQLVHLEDLAMRPATELSGGELQKVILARALAQEPSVLLLDEPINHLDPVNQIEVMSLLHGVTRDLDISSLVVTHDLNSALRFADRFMLLRDGKILAHGEKEIITPEAIKETFHIDVVIEEVGGIPVVVPHLTGIRPHKHVHIHEHEHLHAHEHGHGDIIHTHEHPHVHSHGHEHKHSHEVEDHVHDHEHTNAHGVHEHEHPGHTEKEHGHEHST